MEGPQNVLVVEVGQSLFDRIAPVLQRRSFEVDRFPDGRRALELLAVVPFHAIVIGFPLHELELEEFLSAVQAGESALASVALLASQEHRSEAELYLDRGVDLVLAMEKASQEIQRLLCALLGVSPRAAMRTLVKLELNLEPRGISDRFMAQTEDVSTSGMLVATKRRYSVGTTARFELALPNGGAPVVGEAEVARQTEPGMDRVEGIGFRFLAFDGDGNTRLQRALDQLGIGAPGT